MGRRWEKSLLGFGNFSHDAREELRLFGRDLGQHFAIEINLGDFELMDENAVAHAVFAGGGADADLPERAVIALLQFAVTIGMTTGLGDGGLGFTDLILSAPLKPFGGLENVLTVFDVRDASFNPHDGGKLRVW